MKSPHTARIFVACLISVFIISCSKSGPSSSAGPFEHPGAAFSVEPPDGWHMRAAVNTHGLPYHVFSPDDGDDVELLRTGLWVFAVPIPTDQSLDAANLGVVVAQVLSVDEPGLKATPAEQAETNLGTLNATLFEIEGERKADGAWRGRLLVAVQDDNYLVVMYGGSPEEWEDAGPTAEVALASFVAPVELPPIDEPPLPTQTQRLRDVSDMLTAAAPIILVFAHTSDQPDNWVDLWSGSGFVIHEDGYVVTNRHVVDAKSDGGFEREAFDPVEISWDQMLGRERVAADVVAISYKSDLALLKIRGDDKWPTVPLADVTNVKTGDRIVTVGWPEPTRFGETAISQNEGSLTTIERDARSRPTRLRHSARTTGGNSGGPVYDLDVGAVIGAHYQGMISHAKDFPEVLYHGAVPVQRILWEFPQIAADITADDALSENNRQNLIAYYFLQERYGAAMIEARAVLENDPADGIANAYMYRISLLQGAPTQAREHLKLALKDEAARPLATVFAGRTALEVDNYLEALDWGQRAVAMSVDHPEGHLIQGHALNGMGRFDEAARSFDTADRLANGLSVEAKSMIGVTPLLKWLNQNNVTAFPTQVQLSGGVMFQSLQDFERSIELWPVRNWPPFLYMGVLAAIEGDNQTAIQLRNHALSLATENADGLLAVAWFDLMYGDYTSALALLNEAQRIRTTARGHLFNGWALLLFSQALAETGESAEAFEMAQLARIHYQVAVAISPAAVWAPAVQALIPQLPAL